MIQDMTKGRPLKLIIGFSLPLLLGNLFQQLYNMVDAIVVGNYVSDEAFTGMGCTGGITFLVIGFVIGLTSGFCITVSQSFGAGDYDKMRKYIANSIYLCAVSAIALTVITVLTVRPLLVLLDTKDEFIEYAYTYLIIIFSALSVTILSNILTSILRAIGDSRTPLLFLIAATVINIILDLFAVIVLKLGVTGVAAATVIAQAASALLCFFYMKRHHPILKLQKSDWQFDKKMCAELALRGYPMAFQFSITAVGTIVVQKSINGLEPGIAHAMSIAHKLQPLAIMPMETLGITMGTFMGQNLGAKKYGRIRKGMNRGIGSALVYSAAAFIILVFFSRNLSMLFMSEKLPDILDTVARYFRVTAIFYPFLAVLFILRSSLQSLGYGILALTAGVTELLARILVTFIFAERYGFSAICAASPVAWVLAAVLLLIVYIIKQKDIKQNCRKGSGHMP